ncbi:MAG: VCBS repeat-containing protein [Tannerellaceae bacterium]|nr:VCBS repeat-containing protein [Tannerellaceae bacterium]
MTRNLNWPSTPPKYNLGGNNNSSQIEYEKPLPTVVDLDGDGTPEVVVYNKVYNAKTGAPLMVFEYLNGPDAAHPTAHVGYDHEATLYDDYLGFNYVYDIDLDGIYDVVAGGKVYRITKPSGFNYTTITASGVGDGRTGVADINGDGLPDVVTVSRVSGSQVKTTVWNPGFFRMTEYGPSGVPILDGSGNFIRNATPYPYIMANVTFPLTHGNVTGSNSYVFIGDIDGRPQTGGDGKIHRLPEIAILAGKYTYGGLVRHPNIANISTADGGISSATSGTTNGEGALVALTWDAAAAHATDNNVNNRLKLSFILEHNDRSDNTGFTMFDFDNDGKQEICYRDMETLRVIKAKQPYVPISYTHGANPDVILFKEDVRSYTGFEYPVIADIDNDASAEIVVMGQDQGGETQTRGYIYAVGATGDKFAPALPIWNQYMYDPFKIKADSVTTPIGPAVNRLDPVFTLRREIKDEQNQVIDIVDSFQLFNGTLQQVPYFTAQTPSSPEQKLKFEPIVYKTAAFVLDTKETNMSLRPKIVTVGANNYAEISIGNWDIAKTDVPATTPIAVYRNNVISQTTFVNKYSLNSASLLHETSPGSGTFAAPTTSFTGLAPGDTVRIRIPVPDANDVYWVRLADDSGGDPWVWRFGLDADPLGTESNPVLGIGVGRRQYRDCDWKDQSTRVSKYQSFDDAATVQEFHSIKISILDNDYLPDVAPNDFYDGLVITDDSISLQPQAGYLTYSGTGHNAAITYHHDARNVLTTGIDSFEYTFTFRNPEYNPVQNTTTSAKVYIYVLESATGGFSACNNSTTTVTLAHKPLGSPGVQFSWFDEDGETPMGTGLSRTIQMGEADSVYMIHPIVKTGPYTSVDFPNGKLTVTLVNPLETATMRWTGLVDRNWKNPGNWVEVKASYESPARFAPTICVDVIIPSGATNYPELSDTVQCKAIVMQDRAMLKNPHVLKYSKAAVEIKLTTVERDRFIMWSAPLKNMWSGDYFVTRRSDGKPNWGDTYMMFFQMKNPDYASAVDSVYTMTATTGRPNTTLGLGKSFNFRLTATALNRDSIFSFPRTETQYIDDNNTSYNVDRANSNRFVTDGVQVAADKTFEFTVLNTAGTGVYPRIIQVANPYLAWLDVSKFLAGNSTVLETNGYVAWNGDINSDLVSFYTGSLQNQLRYWIPTDKQSITGVPTGMIPPLKSFFVIRKSGTQAQTNVLKMSAAWTTTYEGVTNPYSLRAATEETAMLRIKATQGSKNSSAILHYNPEAHAYYDGKEDVTRLFYDEIPLAVYFLTPWKDALAIYSDADFSTRNTNLGLRVRDAGEVTLEFSGMETFGHDVWLVDKVAGKEVNLQQENSYAFTVVKAGRDALELNDRFTIRSRFTGNGLITGNEPSPAVLPQWNVSAQDRYIRIQSSSTISQLFIYDVMGALVYRANAPFNHFRVPVSQGLYIVKALLDNEYKVEKVFVK